MVEEDRYCVDISNQLMATAAVIRKANREVLAAHMMGCMTEAIQEGKGQEKIDEIMKLLEKWIKKAAFPQDCGKAIVFIQRQMYLWLTTHVPSCHKRTWACKSL